MVRFGSGIRHQCRCWVYPHKALFEQVLPLPKGMDYWQAREAPEIQVAERCLEAMTRRYLNDDAAEEDLEQAAEFLVRCWQQAQPTAGGEPRARAA